MTNAMTAFGLAVGATSALCFVLMTRAGRRRGSVGPNGDAGGPGSGTHDGWNLTGWFGAEASAPHGSCNSAGSDGWDSGGSCDGGSDGGGGGGD